jgi:DNA repair exonuclease SbcCD ATPase subunit
MSPVRSLPLPTLLLAALAACASTQGSDKADATAGAMTTLSASVAETATHMTKTAGSLEQVVKQAKTDPKKHFDAYTKDLAALESHMAKGADRRRQLATAGQDWLAAFDKQLAEIQDSGLREDMNERREELLRKLEDVKKRAEVGHAQLQGILMRMKDLRSALSVDLTVAGIERVEDRIDDVCDDAQDASEKLMDISKEIEKAAPQFQTAKPPPPPKETKDAAATKDASAPKEAPKETPPAEGAPKQ